MCVVMPHCIRHDTKSIDVVFRAINDNPGITAGEIVSLTGIPRRTVHTAIKRLTDKDEIRSRALLRDARKTRFFTSACAMFLEVPRAD